eukprot:s898_g16.t1
MLDRLDKANTFEGAATCLGIPILTETGARKFSGHTARATGAVHLAQTRVDLWRIQLFGRWGSECFRLYIRDAPLQQLHSLARESSLASSLAAARAELTAILKQTTDAREAAAATASLRDQPMECLVDCEAAMDIAPSSGGHTSLCQIFSFRNRSFIQGSEVALRAIGERKTAAAERGLIIRRLEIVDVRGVEYAGNSWSSVPVFTRSDWAPRYRNDIPSWADQQSRRFNAILRHAIGIKTDVRQDLRSSDFEKGVLKFVEEEMEVEPLAGKRGLQEGTSDWEALARSKATTRGIIPQSALPSQHTDLSMQELDHTKAEERVQRLEPSHDVEALAQRVLQLEEQAAKKRDVVEDVDVDESVVALRGARKRTWTRRSGVEDALLFSDVTCNKGSELNMRFWMASLGMRKTFVTETNGTELN